MGKARFGLIGLWILASGADALEAVSIRTLSLESALQAAQAAVADCQGKGYAVSAAVVDAGGHLLALLRSPKAGPHTADSSRRKAYTALSLGKPTHELARMVAKDPEIQALRDMNEIILILGGGLPIRIDGQVVGGIGVGGAPGVLWDVACAEAGIKAIGGQLEKE
ncbi:hypothetical protein JCM13664_08130 [Methylothermus subterraneus]